MCDGANVCGHGHGHGHEQPGKHGAEVEPPGIRLEAGKGKVYEFTRGLPGDRLVEAVYHCARLEDVGRYLFEPVSVGEFGSAFDVSRLFAEPTGPGGSAST